MSLLLLFNRGYRDYGLTAQGGSYVISGASALLSRGRLLLAAGGSYSTSGSQAVIYRNRKLITSGGSYSCQGQSAVVLRSKYLAASGGSYNYSGSSAVIFRDRKLVALGGEYSISGQPLFIGHLLAGGYPIVSEVLFGVRYGPTGTEYVGTLTSGKRFRLDIATGNLVMILDDSKVMSL